MLFSILKSIGLLAYTAIVLFLMLIGLLFSWVSESPGNGYYITYVVGAFLLAGGSFGMCKNSDGPCHFLCNFMEQPRNHIILLISLYFTACIFTTIALTGLNSSDAELNSGFLYVLFHGYPVLEYSALKWSGAIAALFGTGLAWAVGWGIGKVVAEMVD